MSSPASPPSADAPAPARHRPPGPRGHWLMGNTSVSLNDPLPFYTGCQRRYGVAGPGRWSSACGSMRWTSLRGSPRAGTK